MTDIEQLDVHRDGRVVGQFWRDEARQVGFSYAADEPGGPISLSLPKDRPHSKHAAERFLDNLLPDSPNVRQSWSRRLGVPNTAFDLLGRVGEDVAGALSIVPAGRAVRTDAAPTQFASLDEIADRIMSLKRNPDAWFDSEQLGRARMSLAGQQGKFALARVNDQWLWSSAAVPSTHIFKPAAARFHEAAELEAGGLALAKLAGVEAPAATTMSFLGQSSYVVERFDRTMLPTGVARRSHIEDVAQALGLPPERKYDVTAKQVIDLLQGHAAPDEPYTFVRMMAFNIIIGNADAHAKNYSLNLDEERPRLTPIYDAMPTTVWADLNPSLAMKISGARRSQEVAPDHWAKLARTSDLDETLVVQIVREVAEVVADRSHDVFGEAGVAPGTLEALDRLMAANTTKLMPASSR